MLDGYTLHELDAPPGCRRVLIVKPDGECYETFWDTINERGTCECKGFRYHHKCKHLRCVKTEIGAIVGSDSSDRRDG